MRGVGGKKGKKGMINYNFKNQKIIKLNHSEVEILC